VIPCSPGANSNTSPWGTWRHNATSVQRKRKSSATRGAHSYQCRTASATRSQSVTVKKIPTPVWPQLWPLGELVTTQHWLVVLVAICQAMLVTAVHSLVVAISTVLSGGTTPSVAGKLAREVYWHTPSTVFLTPSPSQSTATLCRYGMDWEHSISNSHELEHPTASSAA